MAQVKYPKGSANQEKVLTELRSKGTVAGNFKLSEFSSSCSYSIATKEMIVWFTSYNSKQVNFVTRYIVPFVKVDGSFDVKVGDVTQGSLENDHYPVEIKAVSGYEFKGIADGDMKGQTIGMTRMTLVFASKAEAEKFVAKFKTAAGM